MTTPQPPAPTPTGLRVIIVGAGFAGLTAGIECQRQGHSVVILEKSSELQPLGDIISFGPNAARIIQRWPGVAPQFEAISLRPRFFTIQSWRGDRIYDQPWAADEEHHWGPRFDGHRAEYHDILLRHAQTLPGLEIRLGARVEDYFEDETQAGVALRGGERLCADVVLAAEGVRSPGRKIVLGFEDKPKPSGYATYRCWFGTEELAKDPALRWLVEDGDKQVAWLGQDSHFIAAALNGGKDFSWVCTHKVRESKNGSKITQEPEANRW